MLQETLYPGKSASIANRLIGLCNGFDVKLQYNWFFVKLGESSGTAEHNFFP